MIVTAEDKRIAEKVGRRIAAARKARKLTQTQLARMMDVTQSTIGSYEIGRKTVPVRRLIQMAKILDVSADQLLGVEQQGKATRKPGPRSRLEAQLDRVRELPRQQQKAICTVLDMALQSTSGARS